MEFSRCRGFPQYGNQKRIKEMVNFQNSFKKTFVNCVICYEAVPNNKTKTEFICARFICHKKSSEKVV